MLILELILNWGEFNAGFLVRFCLCAYIWVFQEGGGALALVFLSSN